MKIKQSQITLSAQADPDLTRIEMSGEVEYFVVPIIMLVEGVHIPGNIGHGELALAEEFGRYSGEDWNGRPVVFNHPTVNGSPVSANMPGSEHIGVLYNTSIDGTKLKSEAWLDTAYIKELDREDINERIEALQNGIKIEISTGLYSSTEIVKGRFNGESFDGVWRNISPDHLALLDKSSTGACSIADGCGGPRINKEQECKCSTEEPENWSLNVAGDMLSLDDRRRALELALEEIGSGTDCYCYYIIMAIYDTQFVYRESDNIYQRSYNIADGGAITLSGDIVSVRPETQFVPLIVTTNQETTMNAEQLAILVTAIIAAQGTQFTEEDRDFLCALESEQLKKLLPAVADASTADASTTAGAPADVEPATDASTLLSATDVAGGVATAPNVVAKEGATVATYLSQAPAEINEVLSEAMAALEAERYELQETIKVNARSSYTAEELKTKSTAELRKIAALARTVDFTGARGGPIREAIANNVPPTVFQ